MLPELSTEGSSSTIDRGDLVILILNVVLTPALGLFAFSAGLINIASFARMDLSQGVNQNLLILSIVDYLVAVIGLSVYICTVLLGLGVNVIGGVSILDVLNLLLAIVNYPLNVSFVVTTVIAIVRCLCVAMPLSFKNVVTIRRQFITIVSFSFLAIFVPLFTHIYYNVTSKKLIIGRNSSEINVSVLNGLRMVARAFDLSRTFLYSTCFIVISISIVILIGALQKSSKFQTSASSASAAKGRRSKSVSSRDAQAMKVVILVLLIFFFCNLPLVMLSIYRLLFSDFLVSPRVDDHTRTLDLLVRQGTFLNVGLNTPVYFFCNSRFRTIVKLMFRKTPGNLRV